MMESTGLERFLEAQQDSYGIALAEIRGGLKRTHWMWYVFPQLKGLGHSQTAAYYGIRDRAEALAYLEHPVLGARLLEITGALLDLEGLSASAIFGHPDDLKLQSSMTLFSALHPADENVFRAVLQKYFKGKTDNKTLALLGH